MAVLLVKLWAPSYSWTARSQTLLSASRLVRLATTSSHIPRETSSSACSCVVWASRARLLKLEIVKSHTYSTTAYQTNEGATNGTLIIDNVDMSSNVPVAVSESSSGATILAGNAKVTSWMQGRAYSGANSGAAMQGASQTAVTKPASLLTSSGNVFARSKPQYESVSVSSFKSVKAAGAKGDGVTDDTAAIQAVFTAASSGDVVYFDHGESSFLNRE